MTYTPDPDRRPPRGLLIGLAGLIAGACLAAIAVPLILTALAVALTGA